METFSALLAICADNREAGDLKRHRTHYDVTVMIIMHTLLATGEEYFVIWT